MSMFVNEQYLFVDDVLLYLSVYEYHDSFVFNFWYLEGCKYDGSWVKPWEPSLVLMHSKGEIIQRLFRFKGYKYSFNWYYTEAWRLQKFKRNFFLLHWKSFMSIYKWSIYQKVISHKSPFNFYCNELYLLQDFKREFITHLHFYKKSVNYVSLERNAMYSMCSVHSVYGWNTMTKHKLGVEAFFHLKKTAVGQHMSNMNPIQMDYGHYQTNRWIVYVYFYYNQYKPKPLTFYGFKYSYIFFNVYFISLELEDFFLNKENSWLKAMFFYINFYNSFYFFNFWFWKILKLFVVYWSMLAFIYHFNTSHMFNFFFMMSYFFL